MNRRGYEKICLVSTANANFIVIDSALDLFQFDYDLTWSAFFMNVDGTIYGRYGTRASEDGMTHMSLASLKKAMKKAMKQALELHKEVKSDVTRKQTKGFSLISAS